MAQPIIQIQNVTKKFGAMVAIDDFSLDIMENEFFSLLGPSGCGKSTLLRMLAGFESPSSGKILIGGKDMTKIPPNKRPVNMLFQSYAVFPHMSVWDNLAYGLKVGRVARSEITERVRDALTMVQLQDFSERKPHQLSGGQRQRVALARALIKHPKVLLLDEPLSALDAKLRASMQMELKRLQNESGITFLVVTHDQSEALGLSERMAVMDKGVIQQVGTPDSVYESPQNRFIADFIGSVNLFEAVISGTGEIAECPALGGKIKIGNSNGRAADSAVALAIRPEKILLADAPPANEAGWQSITATVLGFSYQGDHVISRLQLPDKQYEITLLETCHSRQALSDQLGEGKTVHIHWHIDDMMIL